MLAVATLLLLAGAPTDQTTLPRHPDPDPVAQQARRDGEPTDPWFDRGYVAVDDPAFVLAAVENARQGVMDARGAESGLESAELRAAAQQIRRQNEATSKKLEQMATRKGWRMPQANPTRGSSVHADTVTNGTVSARVNANFILSQIAFHQNTLSHYRAQLAGKGDAELKRTLREAVPGYQKNLELLLTVKP
jgi:predicted outer membrane protein